MSADPQYINEVHLVGRVSGEPRALSLPSGDEVVTWRLVVPRPDSGVDTIDCAAWTAGARRAALRLAEGAVVEVSGSLRRRFWRSPAGPASRYEVQASRVARVRAAP